MVRWKRLTVTFTLSALLLCTGVAACGSDVCTLSFCCLKMRFCLGTSKQKNGIRNEVFILLFIFGRSSKCFTRQAPRTHDDSRRMLGTLLFIPRWFWELNENRCLEERFAIISLLALCFRIWKRDPCASLHALPGKKTAIECGTVCYSNA